MTRVMLILSLLASSFAGIVIAEDGEGTVTIEEAVIHVDQPRRSIGWNTGTNGELQIRCRLVSLLQFDDTYRYEDSHAPAWKAVLQDGNQDVYARLCAAYFLLDQQDEEAHAFVESILDSENLRHRFNAAEVVRMYVDRDSEKVWGVDLLISLLEERKLERRDELEVIFRQADGTMTCRDGSVLSQQSDGSLTCEDGTVIDPEMLEEYIPVPRHPDGIEVFRRFYPNGRGPFPEMDSRDISLSPLGNVISMLGWMKEEKAVSTLISLLDRSYGGSVAYALQKIGDPRAVPPLLDELRTRRDLDSSVVRALGSFQCREAAPLLIEYLDKAGDSVTKYDLEPILEVLLEIDDEQAVSEVERILAGDASEESKAIAKRYLIQVKSPDPVGALLELLESETDIYQIDKTIEALSQYEDERVIRKLADLAATSDSATIRDDAIRTLRSLGNRDSLLALAFLLEIDFPKELNDVRRWKGAPDDFSIYFPEEIASNLTSVTGQDFGQDASRWRSWISENVE